MERAFKVIRLWRNPETGNYTSHMKGLTREAVDALKELKPGQRIILYTNEQDDNGIPTQFSLKILDARKSSEEI